VQGRQAGSAPYDSTLDGERGTSYHRRSSSGGTALSFFTATNKSDKAITGIATSEAAPCPLQPCYFDKWDIFADTWDCQYAMGLPLCIFNNLLLIFPISCHLLMSE
jgi:hypothetical protein